MHIAVRNGNHSDIEQLLELWLAGSRQAHCFVTPSDWETHYDMVRELLPKAKIFVAEYAGRIAGFVGMRDKYIAGLFVAEDCRGKGIGKALLECCKRERSRLILQVYAKNERAVRFYEREGFLITKAQRNPTAGVMEYDMAWTPMYENFRKMKGADYADE